MVCGLWVVEAAEARSMGQGTTEPGSQEPGSSEAGSRGQVARRAGDRTVTVLCDRDSEAAAKEFCEGRKGWSWADGNRIHGSEDQVRAAVLTVVTHLTPLTRWC